MSRTKSYINMLEATARMQLNIAAILEAKAYEAEKAKNWICVNLQQSRYPSIEELHKQMLSVHDSVVEVIDGLTKMEHGLSHNLRVVLGDEGNDDAFDDSMDMNMSGGER